MIKILFYLIETIPFLYNTRALATNYIYMKNILNKLALSALFLSLTISVSSSEAKKAIEEKKDWHLLGKSVLKVRAAQQLDQK